MAEARTRGVYTTLLIVVGVASAFVTASMWPLFIAAGAAGVGWALSASRSARGVSDPDSEARERLAQVSGATRRRHLEVERTREAIRARLSASGRDSALWAPEMERVEQLAGAHLDLAVEADALNAHPDASADLEARARALEAVEETDGRELALVRERLALARAAARRRSELDARLREIEQGLALVRDRVAGLGDDGDLHAEIDALVGGAEAAAAAERETHRLTAGTALSARTKP